ncbi:Uncharacterised protein [Vibrio cholerae]|nr:Uncharacterised protein [Vibrio cholerae]
MHHDAPFRRTLYFAHAMSDSNAVSALGAYEHVKPHGDYDEFRAQRAMLLPPPT